MELAGQLRELRTRAGDPSYRSLERLIARQGRQQKMARSTIQEKLAGRSSLTLPQVLSIVEALAEHARLNGIPLPSQEIDRDTWRDRVTTSSRKVPDARNPAQPHMKSPNAEEWDTTPLEQAHMIDLVNLVKEAKWSPASTWLPRVLREMMEAEMSIEGFLRRAAQEDAIEVIAILKALEDEFPYRIETDDPWGSGRVNEENKETVSRLLWRTAGRHGLTSTPAIIVGLRRSGIGHHIDAYLSTVAISFQSASIAQIIKHLHSATLTNDTERFLKAIGRHRIATTFPAVIKRLQIEEMQDEANLILQSVGESNITRITSVAFELIKSQAPVDVLREVARGVPSGKHDEYAEILTGSLGGALPQMILEVRDEPPF